MLKVREEQIHFWFYWCFSQTEPMHLICLVSISRYTSSKNLKEFYNSQTPPSEGLRSTSTNTLSRMLPMPHLKLLYKRRTWVTPYQEVQMSRPTPNQIMHLKDEHSEKFCPEDLKHWILAGR